jgi:hypothetical protein
VLDEVPGSSCRFDDGAGGREVAAQHGDAAFGQQRLASRPDHVSVPDSSDVQVVDEWTPGHGDGRRVEEIAHLPQNCEWPAGTVQAIIELVQERFRHESLRRVDSLRSRSFGAGPQNPL